MSAEQHDAQVTYYYVARGSIDCCRGSETSFTQSWNETGRPGSTMVFGTIPEVFERIVTHFAANRHDQHTAAVIDAERGQVGLGAPIEASLRALSEHLPGINITFTHR